MACWDEPGMKMCINFTVFLVVTAILTCPFHSVMLYVHFKHWYQHQMLTLFEKQAVSVLNSWVSFIV